MCPDRTCIDRATGDRESSISVDRFVKDRWLVAPNVKNVEITSDVQALVVKSDQEVKVDQEVWIVDVKSSLMGELHSVEGSIIVPEELLVSASAANAAIEKNVWEMQNVVRSRDAYIEWVYSTTVDPESAVWACTLEIARRGSQVFQRSGHCVRGESEDTAAKR